MRSTHVVIVAALLVLLSTGVRAQANSCIAGDANADGKVTLSDFETWRRIYTSSATPTPSDVVDVKSFGARGDGTTDDTTAIQSALNSASTTSQKTVRFPAGTYIISSPIFYDTDMTLRGDGMEVSLIKNSRTRTDISTTIMVQPQPGAIKKNVIVENIAFNQEGDYYDSQLGTASKDGYLLSVAGTDGMIVKNTGFYDVRTMAIWSDNADPTQHVSNLKILNNHVFKANGDGFSFFGNITNAVIDGNTVEDTSDEAIAFQATAYDYPRTIEITNNNILNCVRRAHLGPGVDATPNGINTWGSDNVLIGANHVKNVLASGIKIGRAGETGRMSTNITVKNNVVDGTGINNNPSTTGVPSYGIFFSGSDIVTGENNTLTNNPYGDMGTYGSNTNIHGFAPQFP